MKVIHISDLHYRVSQAEKTKSLVNHIISHYINEENKPVVVITGDLVESPKEERMIGCFNILKQLKEAGHDILICPGNHDVKYTRIINLFLKKIRVHGAAYSSIAPIDFDNVFASLLPVESWNLPNDKNDLLTFPKVNKYGNYYFIGLNSNNEENFATGTIGTDQLDALKFQINRIKSENEKSKIIVYLHHNIFYFDPGIVPGGVDANWLRLTDRHDLRHVLKNNVDAIMFGHFHVNKNYSNRSEELGNPLMNLAGNCTHSNSQVHWFEFDLFENKVKTFEKSI